MSMKSAIGRMLTANTRATLQRYRLGRRWHYFRKLSTKEVFTKIYRDGTWGQSNDPEQRFFSGSGSHDDRIVDAYVGALSGFLLSLPERPSVVDLGCGDFSVGSRVRPLCARYTACDIVDDLVAFNARKFAHLEVDFRVLDLASDNLPAADVVCIRQVLQHLSNAQISRAVPQIATKYRYLVLTEHLPAAADFPHNLDQPSGPDNRLQIGSGIVLTSQPFDLRVSAEHTLCEVPEAGGVVRTTAYSLT